MNYAEAVLLGALQGVAEWLPVSSEGLVTATYSLIVGRSLSEAVGISLWLHIGTADCGLAAFRAEIRQIVGGLFSSPLSPDPVSKFILVATLVSAPIGMALLLGLEEVSQVASGLTMAACRTPHAGDCRSAHTGDSDDKYARVRRRRVVGCRAGRHRAGIRRASRTEQIWADSRRPSWTWHRQARRNHSEFPDEHSRQRWGGTLRGHSHRCAHFPGGSSSHWRAATVVGYVFIKDVDCTCRASQLRLVCCGCRCSHRCRRTCGRPLRDRGHANRIFSNLLTSP